MIDNDRYTPKQKKIYQILLIYLWISLTIILIGATWYFYYQYKKISQTTTTEEDKRIIADTGKLMLLPKDEKPIVMTVSDITKLKNQIFFKDANNGNKVIIFPNTGLAIIYDPKAKIIVNVGPIYYSQFPSPAPQQKVQVGLRNGTDIVGLTYKFETEIKKIFPELEIAFRDQGKKINYEDTMVVIISDKSKDIAESLAKSLNTQTVSLPDGEIKPTQVDILIIVGKDKANG